MKSVVLAFSLVACLVVSSACTTRQPTEASPEELQRLILADGLLEAGQRVRLVTADEVVHEFRIAEIDLERGVVIGTDETVSVAEIVAVDTREASVGRTTLLAGGLAYGALFVIAVTLAPAALFGAM